MTTAALVLAALIGLSEVQYYFAHPHRHGVAPHLIGLSVAVVLLAISRLMETRKQR